MFEYNTHHAKGLRGYFADAHRNGDIIEFGSVTFATTAELADGTNAIRAILVIADSMAQDEFECMFEDIHAHVEDIEQLFDILADEYEIATAETEFVEFADGSVMVATVTATATDTETVTTRHADGTTTTARQTATDALAVIAKGHATLVRKVESEELESDLSDLHDDEILV